MRVGVVWDDEDEPDGNVHHIARHEVSRGEVEEVLNAPLSRPTISRSSNLPIVQGRTGKGRHLIVVYEIVGVKPYRVRPVTAYEPD